MNEEVKIKMIRDYPINNSTPFEPAVNYLSQNNTLSVKLTLSKTDAKRSITGVHKISKAEAVEMVASLIQEKLGIALSGINVFKYIFNNLDEVDGQFSMTFKVNFEEGRDTIGYASTQSIWHGLAELLDKDIIARSGVPGVYYLNPNFFTPTGTIVIAEYYKLT